MQKIETESAQEIKNHQNISEKRRIPRIDKLSLTLEFYKGYKNYKIDWK